MEDDDDDSPPNKLVREKPPPLLFSFSCVLIESDVARVVCIPQGVNARATGETAVATKTNETILMIEGFSLK